MPKRIPQLPQPLKTVNDSVLDRAVRHQHFVERFKTSVDTSILTIFNKELRPLSNKIKLILRKRISRVAKDAQITKVLNLHISRGLAASEIILTNQMLEFGVAESLWLQKTMNRTLQPLNINLAIKTSKQALQKLLRRQLPRGQSIKQWFKSIQLQVVDRIRREINTGIVNDFGIDRIIRSIRGTRVNNFTDGIFNISRRNLVTIVRTTVNDAASLVREDMYRDNTDIISKIQYVAILDARTSLICISLDGTTWAIGRGPRPPMHPGCRSSTIPVLKSWKEMGINPKEIPSEIKSIVNGRAAANISYSKWLKQQSKSIQNEVLGTTRATLWRSGRVKINRFVNDRFRPLTLAQLANREDIEFN